MAARSTPQTSGCLAQAIFCSDRRLIHLPCSSTSQTATALAPPPSRQGRRRRLPLQAPRCCLLPLPFPSPPRPPRASRPHGSTIFLANPPRSRSARCRCVELDFELVRACAPAAAACGARSGTRLAWGSKRSPPRTSLELCPIQMFLGVHLAAQFRFFPRCLVEFRKGETWLTPGPYLEPDLVGLLPWLTGCSILIVVCLFVC